jgi:hypothetical protein
MPVEVAVPLRVVEAAALVGDAGDGAAVSGAAPDADATPEGVVPALSVKTTGGPGIVKLPKLDQMSGHTTLS